MEVEIDLNGRSVEEVREAAHKLHQTAAAILRETKPKKVVGTRRLYADISSAESLRSARKNRN